MLPMTQVELSALLITICFSFLIFSFNQILNKDRSLSKIIGLSLIVPLFLCLFSLFYPSVIPPVRMLHNIDFSLLATLFLLILFWHFKPNYSFSVLLVTSYPISIIFLNRHGITLPDFFVLTYVKIIVVGILSLLTVVLLQKTQGRHDQKGKHEQKLIWGVLLLGTGQIIQWLTPEGLVFINLGVKFLAYLSLSFYVISTTRSSLLAKVTDAEEKLANLNKTINIEVKKKIISLEQHNEHLQNMVMADSLTNTYNKKFILNTMEKMIETTARDEFSIIMFDIDNFKILNDTQGHVAGDIILKKIAAIAKSSIRNEDILGRYGGDEFIIILPGITASETLFVAERFRKKVEEEDLGISVSVGVASYPQDGSTLEGLLKTADAGLYHSKNLGRNTVTHYPQVI